MLDQLLQFDQKLFHAINSGLANHFFDFLMPLLRNRFLWLPLYLFLIIFLIRNYGKRGITIIVFLLITFALCDSFTSSVIKPAVDRLRPCNQPDLKDGVRSLIACGTGYSFPSSHAANHTGIAVFLITLFWRKWKSIIPLAMLWAFSICFAQVYVGVHFPLDVLCGALIGGMIGYITGSIFLAIQPQKTWSSGS
ncbi:MAG: phosphatase family protein [Sphingobacteriaceae bacterium]|jgi:undecaprenyl-diphosphatase|nr:phosphatase family protein [Sphingobacteriaceae bacterium]